MHKRSCGHSNPPTILVVPPLRPGEDDGVKPPDIPRLTSMTDTPPTVSESWVVAEVLVPFMYVNDAAVSYQLRTTPYYILSREQYWERSKITEYDGQTGNTFTQEVTTGISETSSRSLENELKITIAADASFSYGGSVRRNEDGASEHPEDLRKHESITDAPGEEDRDDYPAKGQVQGLDVAARGKFHAVARRSRFEGWTRVEGIPRRQCHQRHLDRERF